MDRNSVYAVSSIFFLAVALVLSGCGTTRESTSVPGASKALMRQQEQKELMEKPYVVGVDDVINVYVRYNPEVSGEFLVGPEGTVFMPLIGEVQVADLNKQELQSTLTERLSKFIINPEVAVGVSQYRSKKVYVIGEVLKPGPVPMKGNILTVWDAIVEAGLPLRTAALWRVHVITPDVEQPVAKRVNLRSIMYGGKLAHNDFLSPGDIVVVPSTAAVSLGSYLGQIVAPAYHSRRLVEVYEFFKHRQFFLDPLYGRFDREAL